MLSLMIWPSISKDLNICKTGNECEKLTWWPLFGNPRRILVSVLMLCAPVFIFTSGQLSSFRAPTLWFIDLNVATCHIHYAFLSLFPFLSRENVQNTKILGSPPFSYHTKRAADVNTGAQSINTESLFNCTLVLSRLNRDCLCPVLSRMRFPRELRCLACNSINNDSVVTQMVRVRPLVAVQASDLPFYAFARLFYFIYLFFFGGGEGVIVFWG